MRHKLQGELDFQGLKIKVENRKGSIRCGTDKDGNEWAIKMEYPYGYIAGTEGTDGEGVDCFIGDNSESQKVFVIHIQNPETGEYDEDKAMLGFDTMQEARDAFLRHYDTYTFLQDITYMPIDIFKSKLKKREGKMLKAVSNIIQLFKGIKVPDLLTLDLFNKNMDEDSPKEGKTVTKNGKQYKYSRSKKNPQVLRLFKEDQVSLLGAGKKDEEMDLFQDAKEKDSPKDSNIKKVTLTDGAGTKKEIDSTGFEKPKEKSIAEKEREKYIRNTIYGRNYHNLKKVIPNLDSIKVGEHFDYKSSGYMDLAVEGYGKDKHGRLVLSIAHFGKQNGDLMSDPKMEIAVDSKNKTVEALTYENHYMGVYKEVYDDMFEQNRVSPAQKKEQNNFLRTWISNLIEQGHKLDAEPTEPTPEKPTPTEPTKPTQTNGNIKESKSNGRQPQTTKDETIKYEEVKGKKSRTNINEEVKKLLAEKEDHEFTKEDKQLLIKYTGRGGLADKETEVDNISLNEFYTLPKITEFIWRTVQDLGFEGGRVLEPSCGTGNFLYSAPSNALATGVEIDNTSGRISDILYGHKHDIRVESFEQFIKGSGGGEFDLVIGNPPFGDRGETIIYDPAKKDILKHEQYFIDRGIDELKADGILAMIVPTGIMDNQIAKWRLDINKKAEFLGAIRMPTGAFKHANAQVTTDIVFFRKRPQEIIERMNNLKEGELNKLYDSMILDVEFVNGNYFEKNPQYALGVKSKGIFGMDVWEGDLNLDELESMKEILKKGKDDYSEIFGDTTVQVTPRTELHVGDIKNLNGRLYRFNENHRWERIEEAELDKYTDIPDEIKEKLGINNLAELNAIENDIAKISQLSREQIQFLSGGFGTRLKREIANYEAQSDHKNEMLKHAVILGLAIKDFQTDLQNRELSTSDAQTKASQLGILVKQYLEIYGNPVTEGKLTKYLGRTDSNPILYLAGAVGIDGNLSKLFTDPIAFTNVYRNNQNIGDYDSDSLYSIAQYLFNNNVPGTVEAIKELYTGEESDFRTGLLSSEDIYLDENLNFAPLHEVCVGEVYTKLDAWKKRKEEIAKELVSAKDEDKVLLNLEKEKLDLQIFELERRAGIRTLDYLPVRLSDAGKIFDTKILNDYLEVQLGANYADKIVYDNKLLMHIPETGIIKEAYLLYTQKGGLDKDEKARLNELLKLYFNKDENPFYFVMLNNLNGINVQWSKKNAERNREELKRISSNFINYIKNVEDSEKITDSYNRLYNGYIQKQFDNSPIEGLSKFAYDRIVHTTADGREITAREKAGDHIWALVRRMYEQGKGLIAHGVGLGKTLEAIALVLLHKETGRAKKPLIVVPKSVVKNWVNEIEKWTKDVNYIVVGMKQITDKDGSKRWVEENREEKELKLLQVASGEFDMVLMSRNTFASIDFSEKTKDRMMQELVSKYYPQPDGTAGKLAKKRYDLAMQNLSKMMTMSSNAMQGIYLENLGFDMLIRDEAHDCKNLLIPLEEEIKGVNSSQSQRAVHNLFASKVIRSLNDEGGIYNLTATPISNSPLEVFNMLIPVAEKELENLGIKNMDDFISTFVEREDAPTTDPDGRVVVKEKFGGWASPEALRKLFFRFTDYKTKDDVQSVKANIKFPKEKPNHVFSQLNNAQKELMKHCQLRLWTLKFKGIDEKGKIVLSEKRIDDALQNGFITPEEVKQVKEHFENDYLPRFMELNPAHHKGDDPPIDDSYFSIQSDMIKITSDLEWYAGKTEKKKNQTATDNSSLYAKKISEEYASQNSDLEKISQLRDNVLQIYKNGGKQLVFAINTKLHDKLFKEFTDAGIKPEEIKIVNGMTVKDSIQRAQISDDFNNGKYKVIIGNYATMGEGLNFNKLTSDVHHLQPAWNYLQIEQGNGRAIRQGNDLDFVNTHYYLTKGSIDAFMNQKVMDKGDMVDKFMRGELNTWDADVELSPEEMMIALAENPETAERLLKARNVALENAMKEKERIGNYRKLSQTYDIKFQMEKATDKESRQYKQLEQELNQLQSNMDSQYKELSAFEQRPIILPNHNAVIKVGSVIKYGSTDDSLSIVKNYTHSTGRIELETWDYSGVEKNVLSLKDFENQYGNTIEKTDMDVYQIFNKLVKEDKIYDIGIVSKFPKDVLKQYKADILDNMREDNPSVIYKDLDGEYSIIGYNQARREIANEGGRIVFPQEDAGVAKYLFSYYKIDNTAKMFAREIYGEKYERELKRIVKGEKAPTYEIPFSDKTRFQLKLNDLAKKFPHEAETIDIIRKNTGSKKFWAKDLALQKYTDLLKKEFYDEVFGNPNMDEEDFAKLRGKIKLTDEEIEKANAIDEFGRENVYNYGRKAYNLIQYYIDTYNLAENKKAS